MRVMQEHNLLTCIPDSLQGFLHNSSNFWAFYAVSLWIHLYGHLSGRIKQILTIVHYNIIAFILVALKIKNITITKIQSYEFTI